MKRYFFGLAVIGVMMPGLLNYLQRIHWPDFFNQPRLTFPGERVTIDLSAEPFSIIAKEGQARVEKIDDQCLRLTSDSGNISIPLAPGEAIYGLTERIVKDRARSETFIKALGGLDRRGQKVTMWVRPSEAVYSPFYISSAGYGMYVEGTNPGTYDIGKTDKDRLNLSWYAGDGGFSCVFIKGGYLEVLDKYTAMTGRPILPPKWAFLPWKWRGQCKREFAELDGITMNAEVVEDITMYEKLDFPKGILMVDRPWAAGNFGYGSFEWDPERFPNGDEMVELLHKRGWKVVVWGGPWALGYDDFELGTEAREKGYLMGNRNIDYTNPEAFEWHQQKIEEFMRRSNIDGWKLDRSDEYNPSKRRQIWHDGRNGLEVHNDYVRLYVNVYYRACRNVRGDDFVIKARPSYTGTTAWSSVWGGDIPGAILNGAVGTDKGLRSAIIALQRCAFMGYPVWGSDTGGYEGFTNRELFARWLEFSAFCPLMEIGGVGEHEPWAMPKEPRYDEEMIDIFRRYTRLHADLADYTHRLAGRAHKSGNPIVHPLVMDWPDDPKVKDMWDEYMYGPALLIAPVWEIGRFSREVYLPRGEWIDFNDRASRHSGPTVIEVDVPLDKIPVFIKADQQDLLPPEIY